MKKIISINRFVLMGITLTALLSCSSESSDTTPEPDTVAPALDFTISGTSSGSEPIVVSNQMEININAQDAKGISKVEAFIDDKKVGEDTTAPYQITIDVSNYTSKNNLTAKFTDYTLKVTVTDTSGNETSKEQVIHIDNELPSITNVSLEDGSVINGDTNTVTFAVSDNEGLSGVTTYLNNSLLQQITDETYEININTLNLSDGDNTLRIEAIDLAGNTTNFDVVFISDNTGPEIVLNTIENGQILDESLLISTGLSDMYSQVTFFDIALEEQNLLTTDVAFSAGTEGQVDFEFNPEVYATGEHILKIIASDALGNESIVEFPIQIQRRLIVINVPQEKLDNGMKMGIVFVSKMDGSLIDWKEFSHNSQQIILRSTEEFDFEMEFMLTFYLEENPSSNAAYISTHQNLTRNNPKVLNLSTPKYLSSGQDSSYQIPITNFLSSDAVIGSGGNSPWSNTKFDTRSSSYFAALYFYEGYLSLGTADLSNPTRFNEYYLYMNNSGIYRYLVLDNPIDPGYILDKDAFSTTNLERRYFTVANSSQTYPPSYLEIFGATTLEDDGLNNYHQIYNANENDFISNPGLFYDLNTSFASYKHVLAWDNYYTLRRGTPLDNYVIPSWNLEYLVNGNTVSLTADQSEPILGRIICADSDFQTHPTYNWSITFDSRKITDVVIPQLPEFIAQTVSEAQNNNSIIVKGAALYSYQSILDYNDYVDKVIKNDKDILDVTDWYQSLKKSYDSEIWYGLNTDFPFNNY
ncbi:Ig-like domain-containing protein [Allomuricauda sp. XS_ASV26]|uniref:Ig-like domain-containing protein n=1 Tax=Allomuricauda sp. XS_ASV26 TaxID=3241292 RepID=UPI003511CCF5